MGYLTSVTVIVETAPPTSDAELTTQPSGIGGAVVGFSTDGVAHVQLPLARASELDGLGGVARAGFDGDKSYLLGHDTKANSKLDRYLAELIDYLRAAPVIVQTTDGLTDADAARIQGYGGVIKDNLSIINAYSASLPLARLKDLAAWDRVKQISYNQTLFPS